ncbi:MAG: HAMP domain-containing sensor histidine kinase, partial [Solimonas sp.]
QMQIFNKIFDSTGGGIRARIGRAFLLQTLFISLAGVAGVVLAAVLLQGVLIKQALLDEEQYFWKQYQSNPMFQLPHTRNLSGYFEDAVPAEIRNWPLGFTVWHYGNQEYLVNVSEQQSKRLYLVFDKSNVNSLAAFYGLVPLAVGLLVLYISAWFGYQISRRAISPIITLAKRVRTLQPGHEDQQLISNAIPDKEGEIRELADALQRYAERLKVHVDREREFTRDVSHELRSPLTVIQMSASAIDETALNDSARRALERIRKSAKDMEDLTRAFLLLAREADTQMPLSEVCVNNIVDEELERARVIGSDKPINVSVVAQCRMYVMTSEKALASCIGNLLRNAFSYTDAGEVRVVIERNRIRIIDTGTGMDSERITQLFKPFVRGDASSKPGYGVGLAIVKRLSDRFGWKIDIQSATGKGTTAELSFAKTRAEAVQ